MRERLHSTENHDNKTHEQLVNKEQQKHNQELALEKARKALAQHREKDTHKLTQEAVQHAQESKAQTLSPTTERDNDLALPGLQQSIKNRAYRRELTKIQTKLPGASRRFSKIIHNKTIESISNVGSQTVARPSGVLGGSIVAFIGSVAFYYSARHYGFRYNYLLLFIFFVGGFLLGSALELCVWLIFRRRQRS